MSRTSLVTLNKSAGNHWFFLRIPHWKTPVLWLLILLGKKHFYWFVTKSTSCGANFPDACFEKTRRYLRQVENI